MTLSGLMDSNTDSSVCYGCGEVIPKGEEEEFLIVSTKSGGLAEGDNLQDVCKACKTSKDVPVSFSFKMFQVEKMRRKAGIKATDIPEPISAKGLAAYIKRLVHKDVSSDEEEAFTVPFTVIFDYPELKELSREVRNLKRYLNRNLEKQMKKMVEELTEPFDSRIEAIDEIIRMRMEWIEKEATQSITDSFGGKADITDREALDED